MKENKIRIEENKETKQSKNWEEQKALRLAEKMDAECREFFGLENT